MLGALVSVMILSGVAASLFRNIAKTQRRMNILEKKSAGENVLVITANQMQEQDFENTLELCNPYLGNTPIASRCVSENSTFQVNGQSATPFLIETLRNWSGTLDTQGEVCVEIEGCKILSPNRLVEVTLRGYWLDANQVNRLNTAILKFRKGRW